MLKNADKELIGYIKKSENITLDLVNDIRNAYFMKLKEENIKLNLLEILPKTKYVEKLINNIYDERDYWQTIVGYWILKKLKEEFPNFYFCLPEEEPESIVYSIVGIMQATILEGESKLIDIVSINDDIGVVKETKRIINATGKLGVKDIEYLYMTESVYHTINKLLNEINENQRLKKNFYGPYSTISVEYNNPDGTKIYSNSSPVRYKHNKYVEINSLWIINGKDPIRLFEFTDDYVKENKEFDSIVNNEQKRKKEQLRLERINKKFQGKKN